MVNSGWDQATIITNLQPAQPGTSILALGHPGCQIPVHSGWEWSAGWVPAFILAIAAVQAVLKTLQLLAGNIVGQ